MSKQGGHGAMLMLLVRKEAEEGRKKAECSTASTACWPYCVKLRTCMRFISSVFYSPTNHSTLHDFQVCENYNFVAGREADPASASELKVFLHLHIFEERENQSRLGQQRRKDSN